MSSKAKGSDYEWPGKSQLLGVFARRSEDVPRSCVFAATTNDESPFSDETGNRRFWPVRCGKIDCEAIERDRDQLWAEAYARFQKGKGGGWIQRNLCSLQRSSRKSDTKAARGTRS